MMIDYIEIPPEQTAPEERFWIATDRLSPKGAKDFYKWVKSSVRRNKVFEKGFKKEPIENFLNSNPEDWFAIFTMYCYADIPMPHSSQVAFSAESLIVNDCDIRFEHVVHQLGIPLSTTERGHKHFLCAYGSIEDYPALLALPERDSVKKVEGIFSMGLCSREDFSDIKAMLTKAKQSQG